MKNEKAFEHDVRRFMTRNNRTIRSTPIWHNVPVSLFQLYLAVHERGGFQKVYTLQTFLDTVRSEMFTSN